MFVGSSSLFSGLAFSILGIWRGAFATRTPIAGVIGMVFMEDRHGSEIVRLLVVAARHG